MLFSSIPSRLLLRSRLCNHQIRNYTLKSKPARTNIISSLRTTGLRAFHKAPTPRSVAIPKPGESPLSGLADSLVRPAKAARGSWPEVSDTKVGFWLLGSAGLVFGIVVLGGLTRLTESGLVVPESLTLCRLTDSPPRRLSITEWKPVTGTLPPLSHDDWMENFNKYKDSPEYRILNPNMTLDEYKFIYFMEWGHRLWGRAIGLTFVLPAIYFTARRRVTPKTALKLLGISGMIGFQGFIAWWMVKSGLRDDLFAKPGSHPRVSQYRLTAHLGAAFTVYAAMLWCGLDILRENRLLKNPADALAHLKSLSAAQLRVFRGLVGLLAAMVFTTAMTGGLVAGLDAGLIYNEFPKMGTGYMPPAKEMMDPFYSHAADGSDLWWRNLLENPTTVQFQHRVMALSTFSVIMAGFAYSRFNPEVAAALPKQVKAGMTGVVLLASLQVLLGIGTLVYMVPTHLAATHQAGALALLTGSIVLGHRVWLPRTAARVAAQRIEAAAAKGAARRK